MTRFHVHATLLASALAGSMLIAWPATAGACTRDDFGRAVDDAGASLRAFNQRTSPKLQARLRELREKKGWSEAEYEEQAHARIGDATTAKLDAQTNELLDQIDQLGRLPAGGEPDCARLGQIEAATLELLAVMKSKSAHMLERIDGEIGAEPAGRVAQSTAPIDPSAATPSLRGIRPEAASPAPLAGAPGSPPRAAAPIQTPRNPVTPPPSWSTTTAKTPPREPDGPVNPVPGRQADLTVRSETAPQPPVPANPAASSATRADDNYTIDEVREATRGFFGTISTSLASVVEHAFSTLGRPSGYVLGEEGGGAFLAGVRYGSGTLYLRRGMTQTVYWHGPSLGYDFGAAGSRTMFLIYELSEPEALFRSYAGLDGSAYVVGGFGVTILKGGDVTMAPIRSGLGLRVGANVGYVRFTREPSWNPF